jgi:hypothetical protein
VAAIRHVGRASLVLVLVALGIVPPRGAAGQAPEYLGEYCFQGLTYSNGQTFFHNQDGPRPLGLYRTNGTPGGTVHLSPAGAHSSGGVDVNGT